MRSSTGGAGVARLPLAHELKIRQERVAVLVDLSNLLSMANEKMKFLSVVGLVNMLVAQGGNARQRVAGLVADGVSPYDRKRELLFESIRRNGLDVVIRPGKIRDGRADCNADLLLAMEAWKIADNILPDTVIIVSGDKDLEPTVKMLQARGIRVEVASSRSFLSRKLAESADVVHILDGYIEQRPLNRRFLGEAWACHPGHHPTSSPSRGNS